MNPYNVEDFTINMSTILYLFEKALLIETNKNILIVQKNKISWPKASKMNIQEESTLNQVFKSFNSNFPFNLSSQISIYFDGQLLLVITAWILNGWKIRIIFFNCMKL